MKRAKRRKYTTEVFDIPAYEGETIEHKVQRIVLNKEPIEDGAEIIYTEKKDGVLPQYNIRTDKWEIAQSAMDLAQQQRIAKSNGTYEAWHKENEKKKEEAPKPDNTEKSVRA